MERFSVEMQKCNGLRIMTLMDEKLLREAAQWIIIQRTRRSLSEIAKEAGVSINVLKYHAEKLMQKEGPSFTPTPDRTNEPTTYSTTENK